jgi:hypothetical protein
MFLYNQFLLRKMVEVVSLGDACLCFFQQLRRGKTINRLQKLLFLLRALNSWGCSASPEHHHSAASSSSSYGGGRPLIQQLKTTRAVACCTEHLQTPD